MEYRLYTSGGMEYLVYFSTLVYRTIQGTSTECTISSLIKFYIQPICIACIFYINYLWLIDKVLFRKKTIRFILYNLLLIVMANVAIYLVHRMVIPESILHQRPTPIPPPRPGFMQWQDSITLVLVVGLSAAIKVTQNGSQPKKNVSSWNRNVPKQN